MHQNGNQTDGDAPIMSNNIAWRRHNSKSTGAMGEIISRINDNFLFIFPLVIGTWPADTISNTAKLS
jgi:hypothetical protein